MESPFHKMLDLLTSSTEMQVVMDALASGLWIHCSDDVNDRHPDWTVEGTMVITRELALTMFGQFMITKPALDGMYKMSGFGQAVWNAYKEAGHQIIR